MTEPEPETIFGEDNVPISGQHARGPVDQDGHSPFPIVAVGASAGGLEAFRTLLAALPDDTGMAFILIQHLDPHHESQLVDLLSKSSSMPMVEAGHGMEVRPNQVYTIRPNTNLSVLRGALVVTPRQSGHGPHLPIDYMFRALAEEQQSRAIGVVLSGTGSDGTLGLCEIKAVGGITFAQEETGAAHAGMPRSARDSGCVDFVLPIEGIARRLVEIGHHPYVDGSAKAREFGLAQADTQFKKILGSVRAVKGVDFSMYRDTTIKRRILRRMALHLQRDLGEYAALLERDRPEVEALYNDLLINVTSFFRDPPLFDALKATVFPALAEGKHPTTPVRVWVPGCSTGQEAYSLAMALVEFFDDQPGRPGIQVFATDLSDPTALDKARAGVYPDTIEAEVTPERLRRFFRHEDHIYRVDKGLREMCVFARQNVAADPPFSHLDLISCRNVLIYLSTPLQKRVLPAFHYALNPTGYLVLGSAETVGENTDLFDLVDRANRIYSKKATVSRPPLGFHGEDLRFRIVPPRRAVPASPTPIDFQRETDRLLLNRFSPPGVLVNENFDVLQFRGRTSLYLEPPAGEPTTNVLKMAREGLLLELRNALLEAKKRGLPTRREGVRVRSNGDVHEVTLEITPVQIPAASVDCYLVLFVDSAVIPMAPLRMPGLLADIEDAPAAARELVRIQQELAATKEYMESMIEQQDAANEELRSANEEILSSNEELQSTNEEHETSKEELQSVNEELTTVNEQLQHRNVELSQANNDLKNLLSSIDIPVIMVGADLRIRRFTPPARSVMNLLPGDIGRPLADLRPTFRVTDLEALVIDVIETVQPREREVQTENGRWYVLRITPYRTNDNRIEGAVILLLDVDQIKRAEQNLREAHRRKDEFLAMLSHELRNPIAPIRNAVEILRLRADDPESASFARQVLDRQLDQLSRIVEDLLDVHRIVERKVGLERRTVALGDVIDIAVETVQPLIEGKHHRLEVTLPPRPVYLDGDAVRLAQVLVNLLNNAAKYTPPGGQIGLKVEPVPSAKHAPDHVRITVRDNGSGIDPDLLPHVFELFTQGTHLTEQGRGGLGIGLALAQNLVEMHGGTIAVASEGAEKGSEFEILLPTIVDGRAGTSPDHAAVGPVDETLAGKAPARRIFVIDDNEDQASSLRELLKLLGHEVDMALDGPTALAQLDAFAPDVVLVDLGLPGMDGLEVARTIRERDSLAGVVLVAQTGWGQDSDRERTARAGFDHHLVKPIELEALNRILAGVPRRG